MATHVGALGLAAGAYWLARRHASNARFTFGSGKFGDLAAFASAVVLGVIALAVAAQSVARLLAPAAIDYRSALPIAAIGSASLASARFSGIAITGTIIMATTTICALPISMCWPTRPPRCWRSQRSTAGLLFGARWLRPRWSASWARW